MVATLFVAGFPDGICVRERSNFCRLCEGFEFAVVQSCHVFAKFDSVRNAKHALQKIEGMIFDETESGDGTRLRAEIAKRDADRPRNTNVEDHQKNQWANNQQSSWQSEGWHRDRNDDQDRQDSRGWNDRDHRYEARDSHEWRSRDDRRERNEHRQPEPPLDAPPRRRPLDAPTERPKPSKSKRNSSPDMRNSSNDSIENSEKEKDTLACKISDSDLEEDIIDFFEQRWGFLNGMFQRKIGFYFAKFEQVDMAKSALEEASLEGYDVNFAKRSLDARRA